MSVIPTLEISEFLNECRSVFGGLDDQNSSLLSRAIEHYGDTGEWLGLPAGYKQGDQRLGGPLSPEDEAAIRKARRQLALDEETGKKINNEDR